MRGAAIPIRLQLTIVLVTLVVAVSLAMIFSAYRAAIHSVEDEAVSGLENAADARRDAVQAYLDHEQQQVRATVKSIGLGCGPTGILNPWCAREDLTRFLHEQHARAAMLTYGKKGAITVGKFALPPQVPAMGRMEFRGGSQDGAVFDIAGKDTESGLNLIVEFADENVPKDETGTALLFVVTPEAIYQTGTAQPNIKISDVVLRSCGSAPIVVEGRNFFATRLVSGVKGACAVAWAPQSKVLGPVVRLRKQLARIGLLFVLGALAVGYVLGYVLTRPLSLLTRRVRQVRKGDFSSPVPDVGSGEVRQLAVAFREMTASVHESLSALATTERRLTLACRAARLWLWEYDVASGAILWVDPAARSPKPRTLSFREFLRRTHPDDRHAAIAAVRSARATGEYAAEYRFRQYGRYAWVEAWGQVVPGDHGNRNTFGGVCMDASGRRESELLRTEQQRLLAAAEMASELAHQINNPLSAVTGAIYMAARRAGEDPEMGKFLTIAEKEGKRLANIARQLVTLYTPSSSYESVDVREVVDAAILTCERQLRERHDSLEAQLESTGRILGFRDELTHAVVNLLTNAVEHSPASSRIVVRTRRGRFWQRPGSRGVRITVCNDSAGLPPQTVSEMLEPFTGTKAQRGTGLGLWVARSIVAKHGGNLRVRSTAKKTVCVVYLPAKAAS